MIVGTAGHIDHGKTQLIRALTGIETDRLREEKERGISIDIGFAWLDLGGTRVGVVDVPGHEKFIRNMLAGAHGIDLVLLVVAADDGVMPQTEEHLDIVHLLGTQRGLVVMTKVDLVDETRRRDVREEIEILVDGTALEGADILEVSAISGEGLDALRSALQSEIASFEEVEARGMFRMPVDRSFVIHGHGAVVTGTATAGNIEPGQQIRILPGDQLARVRSVQVHGTDVPRAQRGQRIALNLAGIEAGDINRGQVVCDAALHAVTTRLDAHVELRPAVGRPLRRHSDVRVHIGTAETMARVLYLDGREELAAKESTIVQLALREPLAAFGGDRFILREQTARATIGGGVILYPFATKPRRGADPRLPALTRLFEASDPVRQLDALLDLQTSKIVTADDLAAAANLRAKDVRTLLKNHPKVLRFPSDAQPDAYTTTRQWGAITEQILALLETFHRDKPKLPGMEMESLHSQVVGDASAKIFRAVISRLSDDGILCRDDSVVRLPNHQIEVDAGHDQLGSQLITILDRCGFTPPGTAELADELQVSAKQLDDCVAQLEREGQASRIDAKLIYSAAVLDRVRDTVRDHIAEHGEIDARGLRDLIGASRKFSIALLTYFDRTGFTMRVGDIRKLRAPMPN